MANRPLPKNLLIVSWILRVLGAAVFLVIGAMPKLTGQQMPIEIFEKLGVEPWGRYLTGLGEAAAGILLLIPRTGVFGGLLGILLMLGALGSHIFGPLGFPMDPLPSEPTPMPMGYFAIVVLLIMAAITFLNRGDLAPGGKAEGGGSPTSG